MIHVTVELLCVSDQMPSVSFELLCTFVQGFHLACWMQCIFASVRWGDPHLYVCRRWVTPSVAKKSQFGLKTVIKKKNSSPEMFLVMKSSLFFLRRGGREGKREGEEEGENRLLCICPAPDHMKEQERKGRRREKKDKSEKTKGKRRGKRENKRERECAKLHHTTHNTTCTHTTHTPHTTPHVHTQPTHHTRGS